VERVGTCSAPPLLLLLLLLLLLFQYSGGL
jgi:hypothetical protein